MPTRVQLPDGSVGEFPDGMANEQIQAVLAKQFPPPAGPFGGKSHNLEHQEYQPIHSMRDVGENAVKAASNFGAGVLQAPYSVGHALLDPKQTAKEVWAGMHDPANIDPTGTLQLGKQVQQGKTAELLGNAGGGWLLGEIGGGLAKIPGAMRPTSSPSIVPPAEVAAENLAKAVNPPGGIKPEFIRNLQSETPAVREYGQRTNNPLNTQAEGIKAAQGVGQEGLQHYRQNILPHVAENRVMLPNQVSPELGHSATLGQVDARITQINAELANMKNAASSGAAIDTLRQSGFERELNSLKPLLYQGIEQGTGIPAGDIKNFREGYGGEYGIANQLEAAKNARLTRTASASQGRTTLGIPHSILEWPDRLVNFARGGEQAIADRQFAKRIRAFDPQAPSRPVANPPRQTPFVGAPVNPETLGKISAVGSDAGVQPTPKPVKASLQGPMQKAPTVAEAEKVSKTFQDQLNREARMKRFGNTGGK